MDEDDINDLMQKCRIEKYKLRRVFAANNFPQKFEPNSFCIVNASPSNSPGTTGFFYEIETMIFFDPLGQMIFA